ncbi:MAG: hypothetical protein ACFB5Z_10655 [Elainellaceae cyanobacterium]
MNFTLGNPAAQLMGPAYPMNLCTFEPSCLHVGFDTACSGAQLILLQSVSADNALQQP